MPRVKRWYHASQSLNRDPEFQELRRIFPDWMGYVWHEMLAWGDHNEGELKGKPDAIAASLSWVSLTNRPRLAAKHIRNAIDFMDKRGWIRMETDRILIANHLKYNPMRETKGIPTGKQTATPPIPPLPNPSFPILIIKKKSKIRLTPPTEAIEAAQVLSDKISENIPNRTPLTESQLTAWAWEAEKINRIDGHSWSEICDLICWCQADSFWKSNILSMQKLRKQWNQLLAKKTQGGREDKVAQIRQRTADILTRGLK